MNLANSINSIRFDDYLLELFYLVDTELNSLDLPPLRSRGPKPTLADSEVITIELAGEFMGLHTDKAIYRHFRRHHLAEFRALARVCRTSFARQSANLWRVKQRLHERVLLFLPGGDGADAALPGSPPLWLVDSFPLRVCRFRRAPGHRLFKEHAAFGRDPTNGHLFFGFRVHLRCTPEGACAGIVLAPANVTDVRAVGELTDGLDTPATLLGDRNYWDPAEHERQAERGLDLQAPFRKKSRDPDPKRSAILSRLRQIIEPVIGQLAVRFDCQRTWARDLWHLTSRLGRKLLSHATVMLLNTRHGNPPLQLSRLVAD